MSIIDKFRIDKLRKWLANDVESFDREVSAEIDRASADKKQRAKGHIERLRGDETHIKREISVEAERVTASIEQHVQAEREKVGRTAKQHFVSGAAGQQREQRRQVGTDGSSSSFPSVVAISPAGAAPGGQTERPLSRFLRRNCRR